MISNTAMVIITDVTNVLRSCRFLKNQNGEECYYMYAFQILPCGYVKLFLIPYTDLLKKRSKWIYIYRASERCLYRCYLVTQVMHLRYFAMDSFNKKALQQGILQFWNGIVISLYKCHREILSFIFPSLHEIVLCCSIIWIALWI